MSKENLVVERIQTGVRMEKRIVKVSKALAEYLDISLGDLFEGIILHAFDGKATFSEETLKKIKQFKEIYELNFGAEYSHKLIEKESK